MYKSLMIYVLQQEMLHIIHSLIYINFLEDDFLSLRMILREKLSFFKYRFVRQHLKKGRDVCANGFCDGNFKGKF